MVDLEPDCENCAALCCVALAFDRSEMFAFDKAAGEACRHLERGGRCSVHAQLAEKGFSGCVAYQCDGAGQRVVQEVFKGRSWQEDPALLPPMLAAFSDLRAVHKQLVLVRAAEKLALSEPSRKKLALIDQALAPEDGWTAESLSRFVRGSRLTDIQNFWRSLADELDANRSVD